jgi:hypothetical protein
MLPVTVLPVIVAPTAPAPPEPPVLPAVAPVLVVSPPALTVEALLPVDDLTEIEAPPVARLTPPPRDDRPRVALPPAAPWTPEAAPAVAAHAFASVPAAAKPAAPRKTRDESRQPRRAQQLVVLGVDAPAGGGGGGGGGGASGGGGNGGSGGTAALAPWLLLSFLGYAALRLPAGRRMRRPPAEEIDVRPG